MEAIDEKLPFQIQLIRKFNFRRTDICESRLSIADRAAEKNAEVESFKKR